MQRFGQQDGADIGVGGQGGSALEQRGRLAHRAAADGDGRAQLQCTRRQLRRERRGRQLVQQRERARSEAGRPRILGRCHQPPGQVVDVAAQPGGPLVTPWTRRHRPSAPPPVRLPRPTARRPRHRAPTATPRGARPAGRRRRRATWRPPPRARIDAPVAGCPDRSRLAGGGAGRPRRRRPRRPALSAARPRVAQVQAQRPAHRCGQSHVAVAHDGHEQHRARGRDRGGVPDV